MEDLVETIVTRYRGEARLQRLRWLLIQAASSASDISGAVKAMVECCQQDGNLHRYRELFELLKSQSQDALAAEYDSAWVQEKETSLRQDRAVLRHRLASVQSHLHKEAIRAAYLAVAEHDWRVGDVVDAFHSVLRAKDYCTTRQQTTNVCLMIVDLAILMNNQAAAKEWLLRLEHTVGTDTPPSVQQKIETASGLERLLAADYDKAAAHFAKVCKQGGLEPSVPSHPSGASTPTSPASPPASGGTPGSATGAASSQPSPPTVLAPEDISLYAAFLAMGCAKGPDMVALAEHPEALELVPRLKEALVLFGRRCDYRAAWAIFEEYLQKLKYDLYMAPHLPALQTKIREKAVASYWKAYERVELQVMADELGPGLVPSVDALRTLLVKLIQNGTLQNSRIDLGTQTLHRDPNQNSSVRAKLDKLTRNTLDDTYSTLTRLACLEHDLVVSSLGGGSRSRRGGGLARGGGGGSSGSGPSIEEMEEDDDDVENADTMEMGDGMNPEDMY